MATTYTAQAATDKILYSESTAYDVFLAAVEDRTELISHPAVADLNAILGPNFWLGKTPGASYRVPIKMALPLMTSTAETTDVVAATTIDIGYTTATFSQYDLAYGVSDLVRQRDPTTGLYQVVPLASELAASAVKTGMSLLVALAGSASKTVGSSGSPLTWDDILVGRDEIVADMQSAQSEGNCISVLHPRQWALVRRDLGASSGARANRRELDTAQGGQGLGYQGTYDDIDVYTSTHVDEDAGDYTGMIAAPGAIGVGFIPPATPTMSEHRVLTLPIVAVEEVRDAADKSVKLNANMQIGVVILRTEGVIAVLSTGSAALS